MLYNPNPIHTIDINYRLILLNKNNSKEFYRFLVSLLSWKPKISWRRYFCDMFQKISSDSGKFEFFFNIFYYSFHILYSAIKLRDRNENYNFFLYRMPLIILELIAINEVTSDIETLKSKILKTAKIYSFLFPGW